MAFQDNTFDKIISICVFCSVPDPIQDLKEIRRVIKPNGSVLMVEHMRSDNEAIGKEKRAKIARSFPTKKIAEFT